MVAPSGYVGWRRALPDIVKSLRSVVVRGAHGLPVSLGARVGCTLCVAIILCLQASTLEAEAAEDAG